MTDQPGLFDPPPEKGKKKGIRDPAQAVAVAKCYAHQLQPLEKFLKAAHPKECKFCKVPMERKLAAILEFNEWAGFNVLPSKRGESDWPDLDGEVEGYMRLPPEDQRKFAARHAGYDPEWYEKNTGYEYPPSFLALVAQKYGIPGGKEGRTDSVIDDKKAEGVAPAVAEQGPVGGRPADSERRGRGIGGPEKAPRANRRGLPDPEAQASGPEAGDQAVPADRYHDEGGNQPF